MGRLAFLIAAAAVLTRGAHGTTQCEKGPCGPGNERCVGPTPQQYVFHLSDLTCAINDPNGPFYDEVHGMYHNFYQDHLAEPQPLMGPGRGPDWGHWVSRDFLHWARLPVAIWNDQWYDAVAIFSGSTTIVNGKPVIVYPGLCNHTNCPGGSTYDAVVPSDPSDPLYTNWTKPSYNPLVTGTGDDPSTAWQTPAGEWRLIGNQGCDGLGAPIYGSMDFVKWYKIGCTTLKLGDCPTFFPLPPLTPGSVDSLTPADLDALPNWVHKAGSNDDQVQVGTWTEGKPGPASAGGTPGTWVQMGGSVPLDNGKTHASKDFWDPVKKRRIMWVWGTLPNGIQTIPRDMTYDPRTGKINYAPVEEMKELRSSTPLASLPTTPLSPNTPVTLKASSASDIEVYFARPSVATNLTLTVAGGSVYVRYTPDSTVEVGFGAHPRGEAAAAMAAADEAERAAVAAKRAVVAAARGGTPTHTSATADAAVTDWTTRSVPRDNADASDTNSVSVASGANLTTWMDGTDLGGNDFPLPCKHYPPNTNATVCEALCRSTQGCGAWVYVIRGNPAGSGDCCLKHNVVQNCPTPNPKCTSGVLVPTTQCHTGGGGDGRNSLTDTVTMLPSDTEVSIRVFLDTAVAEAYFMGGRVAMTIPVAAAGPWDVQIASSAGAVQLINASSWGMSSIYVTPDEVLATPRRG